MPKRSFTNTKWCRLLKSQSSLYTQEEELLEAQAEIIVKLIYIRKQERLLRKWASDFIIYKYEDIAKLEELECREKEELDHLEKERVKAD